MIKFHFKKMKYSKTSFSNFLQINLNERINQIKFDLQQIYVFQQKIEFFKFVVIISRLDIIFAFEKLVQF